jgi:hypothetical protein
VLSLSDPAIITDSLDQLAKLTSKHKLVFTDKGIKLDSAERSERFDLAKSINYDNLIYFFGMAEAHYFNQKIDHTDYHHEITKLETVENKLLLLDMTHREDLEVHRQIEESLYILNKIIARLKQREAQSITTFAQMVQSAAQEQSIIEPSKFVVALAKEIELWDFTNACSDNCSDLNLLAVFGFYESAMQANHLRGAERFYLAEFLLLKSQLEFEQEKLAIAVAEAKKESVKLQDLYSKNSNNIFVIKFVTTKENRLKLLQEQLQEISDQKSLLHTSTGELFADLARAEVALEKYSGIFVITTQLLIKEAADEEQALVYAPHLQGEFVQKNIHVERLKSAAVLGLSGITFSLGLACVNPAVCAAAGLILHTGGVQIIDTFNNENPHRHIAIPELLRNPIGYLKNCGYGAAIEVFEKVITRREENGTSDDATLAITAEPQAAQGRIEWPSS